MNKHIQQHHERRDIKRSLRTSRGPEHITFAERCSDNKFVHIINKQKKSVILHRVHMIRQGPVYYCQVRNQLQLLKTSVTTIPSRTTVMAVLATRIRSLVTRHKHQ